MRDLIRMAAIYRVPRNTLRLMLLRIVQFKQRGDIAEQPCKDRVLVLPVSAHDTPRLS